MVQTAVSLVPPGLIPVAVFPPYNADYKRRYPAISVIFSENPNTTRKNKKGHRPFYRKTKKNCSKSNNNPCSEPLYGFRTMVILVDKQSCENGASCDSISSSYNQFHKKKISEDFASDHASPKCKIIPDHTESCKINSYRYY